MKFFLNTGRMLRAAIVFVVVGLVLSGCSTFGRKQKIKLAYVERPAETLYTSALEKMDTKRWDEAILFFDEVPGHVDVLICTLSIRRL